MCHVSMKLSDKFDTNQMYTSDKIVVKHISVKETLKKKTYTAYAEVGQLKGNNNKVIRLCICL